MVEMIDLEKSHLMIPLKVKQPLLLRLMLIAFLQFMFLTVNAQVNYYKQVETITANSITDKQLFSKLDSLKQTRRPTDSYIRITFDRDIDFGYKHQRVDVQLNGAHYYLNLLVKGDTILLKKALYGNSIFEGDTYDSFNKDKTYIVTDTNKITSYLKSRNKYYKSSKGIIDLKRDLDTNIEYAFRCGDGLQKTQEGLHIESLVKNRNISELNNLISSICCEEQAFGTAGFAMLKKKGYKISKHTQKLITHIKNRKSPLVVCNGCFVLVK